MDTPFTTAEFLDVFARYNLAVWPAQLLFYLLAAMTVWLAWRPRPGAGRWIGGVLAFSWAWMAVVYHAAFFTAINPAAWLFAALFLLQAALLVHATVLRGRVRFRAARTPAGVAGTVLVGYALVLYPLLGFVTGLAWPRAPTFGLPCPTTIFTLGALLWVEGSVPARLFAVPVAWSLVAGFAAWQHGILPDYGLPAAALGSTAFALRKHRTSAAAPVPA